MKTWLVIALLWASQALAETKQTMLLDYGDFGPQAAAYELLGMQWWQWQSHGDSRPRHYDINVAVYKDINLEKVKAMYPVDVSQEKDYRYVKYADAMRYLDEQISENVIPELTEQLWSVKAKIKNYFGG